MQLFYTWFLTALAILRNSLRMTDLWLRLAGLFCFFVLVVKRTTAISLPLAGCTVTVFLLARPGMKPIPQLNNTTIGIHNSTEHAGKQTLTRVLVGVDIVEVVGLLAELNLGIAIAKLLDQEGIILPHDLPDQRIRNRRHLSLPKAQIQRHIGQHVTNQLNRSN